MRKTATMAGQATESNHRHGHRHSATVTPLASSTGNCDLDFWVKVIESEVSEDKRPASTAELRQQIIERVQSAVIDDDVPDQSACSKLGVPTFYELILANPSEFSTEALRKVKASVH